ncbi:RNA polymerase sigma factor [Limibacterium fermenti]|uniref:RNA polymerase sigma factor n=1 Tax=Limibacterium fermenti TaxID=3229863 RepID=UPI000E83862C|nr:RNA polymerase subunit sigma-70 [Porphyromonadaceae bacterium]
MAPNRTWKNFLEGDSSSFGELYNEYFQELFMYGLKLGFTQETVQDAVQDVFYTIYVSRNKLDYVDNIEFYLLHCLKNRLFDLYKQEEKISAVCYDDLIVEEDQTIVDQMMEKEEQDELRKKVQKLVKGLSPKQRKIIYYRYQLNLNYNEIGIILKLHPTSVKKAFHRAIKKIKDDSESSFRSILLALYY